MGEQDIDSTSAEVSGEGVVLRPQVRLQVFAGPLDLLLHLIKKNEVEITDIPVAAITEQYLAYLDLLRDLRLDVAGEFLVMAATLMLIKSRLLLPQEAAVDEEEEGEDPRADLVRRLLEYQRYREAAAELADRPQLRRDVFARETTAGEGETPAWEPGALKASPWELLEAFRRVLERLRPDAVHEVRVERISLRQQAQLILGRLQGAGGRLEFEALFSSAASRVEVIVTFLALLELVRLRAIEAQQADEFGPIICSLGVDDAGAVRVDWIDEYGPPAKEEKGGSDA